MRRPLLFIFILMTVLFMNQAVYAQTGDKQPEWGPKDTLIVSIIKYEGETLPYKELENVYISNLPPDKLAKAIEKYNRLRNAVYVTYPFARTAGVTLNDVAKNMEGMKSKKQRKEYIKTREKELKKQFTD